MRSPHGSILRGVITVTNNPTMTAKSKQLQKKRETGYGFDICSRGLSVSFVRLFVVLPSVYMETATLRLCVWPWSWEEGPFVQLAYSTTMCLRDSPPACPSGLMLLCLPQLRTVAREGLISKIEQASFFFPPSSVWQDAERLFATRTPSFFLLLSEARVHPNCKIPLFDKMIPVWKRKLRGAREDKLESTVATSLSA